MLGFGATSISAQQFDTYYSPEKRFSIDYPFTDKEDLNITDLRNGIFISTPHVIIGLKAELLDGSRDVSEHSIYIQKGLQELGYEVMETSHPVLIDAEVGYAFTLKDYKDNEVYHTNLYLEHGYYTYHLQVTYNPDFIAFSHIDKIAESIKFFD